MKLDFSKSEIEEIIETYYRNFEGEEVKAKVSYESARLGYGMGEYDGCLTTFTITGTMDLLGKKQKYEQTISGETLKKIFTKVLKKAEFTVTSLTINSGVRPVTSGYGMTEHTENQAYFNGVTIEGQRQKTKEKQLIYRKEGF